jgi:hypothetical protein
VLLLEFAYKAAMVVKYLGRMLGEKRDAEVGSLGKGHGE